MFFNVSGLVQEGIGSTRSYSVEETIKVEGRPPEDVIGAVELLRTKVGVLVRAHLSLVEPEVCSRCLRPLEETVRIDFEEEFQATTDPRSGEQVDEELDPDAFKIDENHMLDLTDAVLQYRETALEMQPLCRPDCRGLCPNCGQDWNEGDCDCDRGLTDNRWAGLSALRGVIAEGKD
jgi:uncharacterized protein